MRVLQTLLWAAFPLAAQPVVYTLQPAAGSRFALEIEKTGLMSGKKHLFVFDRYQGRVEYDDQAPEKSRVELTIEAASGICQDTWVSPKDLKKVQETAFELMGLPQHKTLRFVSKQVTRKGPGEFEVVGDLTVRGLARPVTVAVKMEPAGGGLLFSGSAVVRIKDYGLKPPSAVLGSVGTRNEMRVEFRLAATQS